MKRKIRIEKEYEIEVNDDMFTDDFLSHFKRFFYSDVETIEDHCLSIVTNIDLQGCMADDFQEGYGNLSKCGIKVEKVSTSSSFVDDNILNSKKGK